MKTHFENLDIYKLSEQLADEIWVITTEWDWYSKHTVGVQLVRSADSIGADIAEGSGRYTPKDRLHFLRISRGSLYETKHWLWRAYQRKLLKESDTSKIKAVLDEIAPKLNAYMKTIQ